MRLEVCRKLAQHSSVLLQDILHVLHAAASEQRASMEAGRPICHPKHTSMHVSEGLQAVSRSHELQGCMHCCMGGCAQQRCQRKSLPAVQPDLLILNSPVPERLLAGLLLLLLQE
jgi:hypothetical protein